jgi:hypothetical protein
MPEDPEPQPLALFRLFNTESDDPILVVAPARQFNHYLQYKGRVYHLAGSTVPGIYDIRKYACAWDFEEIMPIRKLIPLEELTHAH